MQRLPFVMSAALGALLIVGLPPTEAHARRSYKDVRRLQDKDPVYSRYFISSRKGGGYRNQMFLNIKRKCSIHLHRCKWGYDAFQGRPVPKVGQWLMDNLAFAPWGYRGGRKLAFKLGAFDSGGAARAVLGLLLYPNQGAVNAIAATIATAQRNNDLWGGSYKHYPIRALWYLSAKNKADTIIRAMHDVSPYRRDRERYKHVIEGMSLLDSWKLSRAQIRKLEKLCVEKIFGQRMSTQYPVYACVRFLGRIRTKNSDAREFLKNYARGRKRALKVEAIRAVGHLRLRSAKSKLQDNLDRAKRTKTKRIRRRRRYKRKKITYWDVHHEAVPTAVALLGMRDRNARKAIAFWLSTEKRGGRLRLGWSQGFTALYREAGFASPKALRKLKPMLKRTYRKVKRASRANRNLRRYVLHAAIGLAQLGDRSGWSHLIDVLKDSDYNNIKMVLKAFGGDPDSRYAGGRDITGIGRLPVGKRGVRVRYANRLVKLIKKRFRFWAADDSLRKMAIETVFNLQARITIAKKRL